MSDVYYPEALQIIQESFNEVENKPNFEHGLKTLTQLLKSMTPTQRMCSDVIDGVYRFIEQDRVGIILENPVWKNFINPENGHHIATLMEITYKHLIPGEVIKFFKGIGITTAIVPDSSHECMAIVFELKEPWLSTDLDQLAHHIKVIEWVFATWDRFIQKEADKSWNGNCDDFLAQVVGWERYSESTTFQPETNRPS